MRNTILLVLIGMCSQATAQFRPASTQFDTFINRPSVEWAAYASDTVRCPNLNLNALLRERFKKGDIHVTFGLDREMNDENILDYKTPEDIKWEMYPHPDLMFDSAGNQIPINWDAIKPTERFDSTAYNLIFAEQIFFIENGLLKSYIPYTSPAVSIYSNGDLYLGIAKHFSSCFNFNYNYQPGKQNKISFISQSKKTIRLDTAEQENKLKELYGRNLIETLWPYVLKNKYQVYLPGNNKKIDASEITTELIEKLTVPVYDSAGNETGKFVKEPLNPKIFTAIELQQDWYYDHTNNIVFNKIKSLSLYAKKWDNQTGLAKPVPILKIVFK